MIKNKKTYNGCCITLLLCLLQAVGTNAYAQHTDSLATDSLPEAPLLMEMPAGAGDSLVADSIATVNGENLARLDSITRLELAPSAGSPVAAPGIPEKIWLPNPAKATWLAVVFPGGGQIYNRKYWKLPLVYGGFAGCAYALSWNNKMFKDYSQAYVDIMDGDPNTNSYYDLIVGVTIDEKTDTRYAPLLKGRKDYYRRYRDISVFAFIGVYLLSIVDAYVDAELSNFDISPDLSMRVEPVVISNQRNNYTGTKGNAVGLQCSITF